MTFDEAHVVTVLAFVALGAIAVLASLGAVYLQRLAPRPSGEIARARTLSPLRGDADAAARLIDHRQATWRLRC